MVEENEIKETQQEQKQESNKHKPFFELRQNNLKVVVWKNQKQRMRDITTYFTCNITNNFVDRNNRWQKNNTFFIEDIPRLILMLQKVYDEVVLKK